MNYPQQPMPNAPAQMRQSQGGGGAAAIKARIDALTPEQRDEISEALTPEVLSALTMIFGPNINQILGQFQKPEGAASQSAYLKFLGDE